MVKTGAYGFFFFYLYFYVFARGSRDNHNKTLSCAVACVVDVQYEKSGKNHRNCLVNETIAIDEDISYGLYAIDLNVAVSYAKCHHIIQQYQDLNPLVVLGLWFH